MAGLSDRTLRFLGAFSREPASVARRLAAAEVELVAHTMSPPVEIALALTATLLLRLDEAAPRLRVNMPRTRTTALPRLGNGALVDELAAEHAGFSSVDRLEAAQATEPDLRLVFDGDAGGLQIGTSGWACGVGHALPRPPGNPIAAAFAGVLAASEALKTLMKAAGIESRRIRPWRGAVSLWDYSLSAEPGGLLPDVINLDGHAFVGCGGVASATAWALRLMRLAGAPLAVDRDAIDDAGTNLNRHLTAGVAEVGRGKAELLAEQLNAAGARTVAIPDRWQEVPAGARKKIAIGVISVDDDATRRDFQLDLPWLVLNAGTSDTGFYQVTHHNFLDEACLACVARSDKQVAGPEEAVARRLGMSKEELLLHLKSDSPVPESILAHLTVAPDELDLLRRTPGRMIVRVVCGQFRPVPGQPAVSAPMLSTAPGVLLAAEIVKAALHGSGPLSPSANMVGTDIVSGPHDRWCTRRGKQLECHCRDEIYRSFYRRKWSALNG